MAGLQGGHRDPCCDNGRISGGKAGSEHRYSFPAVDDARHDEAKAGAMDADSRWGAVQANPIQPWPNTMGQPRGKIMGKPGPGSDAPNGFKK